MKQVFWLIVMGAFTVFYPTSVIGQVEQPVEEAIEEQVKPETKQEKPEQQVKEAPQPPPQVRPAPRVRYIDVIKQQSDSIKALENILVDAIQSRDSLQGENTLLQKDMEQIEILHQELQETLQNKSFLGLELEGSSSSLLMLLALVILFLCIAFTIVLLGRARKVAREKEVQYQELLEEFENYRKASRERFEKQAIQHFNELKKLKKI